MSSARSNLQVGSSGAWVIDYFQGASATLVLVVTGNIAGASTFTAGPLLSSYVAGLLHSRTNLNNNVQIVPQTCQVTTANVAVALDNVRLQEFTGVDSTAKPKPFDISLNCSGARTNVFMTLTDAVNPANRTSTLAAASGNTATNIGVQILRGDGTTPVNFGPDSPIAGNQNQFSVGAANNSALNVRLIARYRQTAASPTAGKVRAMMTFTMSYQ